MIELESLRNLFLVFREFCFIGIHLGELGFAVFEVKV